MFAFVVYALVVWFLVAKFRRTWLGYSLSAAGFVGVVLIGMLHIKIRDWSGGAFYLGAMQMLLYPYGLLVLGVALFIASIPRRYADGACQRCGYDLGGLESLGLTCPECGARQPVTVAGERCGLCHYQLGYRARKRGICPNCLFPHVPKVVHRPTPRSAHDLESPAQEAPADPEPQDQRRHHADQHDIDRAQLSA